MIFEELDSFLDNHQEIEWMQNDSGDFVFRHTQFDSEKEGIKITLAALKTLTPEKLNQILIAGRNVDHITRITGYFSKVSGWNKGKKGELADRERVEVS